MTQEPQKIEHDVRMMHIDHWHHLPASPRVIIEHASTPARTKSGHRKIMAYIATGFTLVIALMGVGIFYLHRILLALEAL